MHYCVGVHLTVGQAETENKKIQNRHGSENTNKCKTK